MGFRFVDILQQFYTFDKMLQILNTVRLLYNKKEVAWRNIKIFLFFSWIRNPARFLAWPGDWVTGWPIEPIDRWVGPVTSTVTIFF